MRLDLALVARGLARSRNQAAQLLQEQRVSVNGQLASKASQRVDETADIHVDGPQWVSRAATKLLGALADSGLRIRGRVLDAGASTGGFTQVALAMGASHIYAVDVGHNQLAPELRGDPRVTVREGLNLRNLTLDDVDGQPVDIILADVSFISLRLLLAPLTAVLAPAGEALLLVKPQFEVGKSRLGAGGVVADPAAREEAVNSVIAAANQLGWECRWSGPSQVIGAHGNQEFFIRLGAVC